MSKYTPMMQQYIDIKKENKKHLLFFRLGDFYELFFEDAKVASRELEITLTGKDCGMEERAPMCGVPFHSADSHINKLISKGYSVAICEQVEDPKNAKGIVKREVIRVVTPGTVLDTSVLEEEKNNYIMCIYESKDGYALSIADVSTGEFLTTEFKSEESNKVIDEIAKYNPSEIICNGNLSLSEKINTIFDLKLTVYYQWSFESQNAYKSLCSHFKTLNLSGFGIENNSISINSSGALMEYLVETQKNALSHISTLKKYSVDKFMVLDLSSRRNLELTQTIREKSKKGSLLWVLDKTKTAMGARLLRKWIEQPLLDVNEINNRLDSVEQFKKDAITREEIKELLNTIYDIERIMSRVIYSTANARDLTALKSSFENLPFIKQILSTLNGDYLKVINNSFDVLEDLYKLIDESIAEESPFSIREGGIIKENYDERVDKLRCAKDEGSDWILQLEREEKEATGIKNLKVRYNKVFGYYIEVTKSYLNLVPDRYIRKQTLSNCERFITPKLKEIEETILGADEEIVEIEYQIFCGIRKAIADNVERIQKTAYIISVIDVFHSLGEVAERNNYIKPCITENNIISITDGRHPIVEKTLDSAFIPNDTFMDTDENRLAIITGPNMAGKSTYMRQVALLVIMAQIGCFIPASTAKIGIADRIFTRVGASDDLATGQSTFMVEMTEVANILHNSTNKSLLILDEIGRGTSTYDGLSIAWGVLEHIADKTIIGGRTLFSTHYHELLQLEEKVEGIKNYSVSIQEKGDEIIFLRKIIRGGADRSYGIHVAKLAGVPDSVIKRALEILSVLDDVEVSGDEISKEETRSEQGKSEGIHYSQKRLERNVIILEELINMEIERTLSSRNFDKLCSLKYRIAKI